MAHPPDPHPIRREVQASAQLMFYERFFFDAIVIDSMLCTPHVPFASEFFELCYARRLAQSRHAKGRCCHVLMYIALQGLP